MRPMLSATYTEGMELPFPMLCSTKLDGCRTIIQDGVALSRSLKPFPNKHLQSILGKPKYNGLDGEIIVGDPRASDCFRKTGSFTSSIDKVEDFKFFVFDEITFPDMVFEGRLERASFRCSDDVTVLVPHYWVNDMEDLNALESQWLGEGYEGAMLRDPIGKYKFGRSTPKEKALIKLKRFTDGDCRIIGFEEKFHNENEATTSELGLTKRSLKNEGMKPADTLGALIVQDLYSNVEFKIGTGMDDALRKEIWNNSVDYLNRIVKYKFFPSGGKDKPRHPVFLAFRSEIDL